MRFVNSDCFELGSGTLHECLSAESTYNLLNIPINPAWPHSSMLRAILIYKLNKLTIPMRLNHHWQFRSASISNIKGMINQHSMRWGSEQKRLKTIAQSVTYFEKILRFSGFGKGCRRGGTGNPTRPWARNGRRFSNCSGRLVSTQILCESRIIQRITKYNSQQWIHLWCSEAIFGTFKSDDIFNPENQMTYWTQPRI